MHQRLKAVAWGGVLFVSLSIGVQRSALAEPSASDKAAAETLFVDARKLLAAGKYQEACKALAESQRLDPGVGTLLNLGRCYEKLGRTASAWSTYREAAAAARAANQGAREKNARLAADALEPKLPKLTIVVMGAETNPRLEVRRDGAVVPPSMWGMAVAVDPGEHLFEASAPDRKPWRTQIVAEKGKPLTVTVPALEPDPKAAAAAPTQMSAKSGKAETTSAPAHVPEPAPPSSSGVGPQRVVALVVGGAGLVSMGVGGYFAMRANSTYDAADCDKATNECSAWGIHDQKLAYTRARNATYFAVGGLTAVVAGVILWATGSTKPSTDSATNSAPRRLWISADPVGETGVRSVTVGGTF
jgi:tetratricopeptide (TPR) repeat protein